MARSRYITPEVAGALGGLSANRIRQLVRGGVLKGVKRYPGVWMVREADVKASLASPRKSGPPQGFRWTKKTNTHSKQEQ